MIRKRVERAKSIMGRKLEEEWIFLHLERGAYSGLNETGSVIWDALGQPRTVDQLLDLLKARFQIDPETLKQDLQQFLEQLEQEGLITVECDPA